MISATDAASLLAGRCGRQVLSMACLPLDLTSVPSSIMRKVDTAAPTPVFPLFPYTSACWLVRTGGDVVLFCGREALE